MQDNLEFLQWTKRHWDQYFPGTDYDALARRKGAGAPATASPKAAPSTARTMTARRPTAPVAAPPARAPRTTSANGTNGTNGAAMMLTKQLQEVQETVVGLERERDFYFNKLREIEVLLQHEVEAKPELEQDEEGLVPRMQAILYSTEEGFEIPAELDENGATSGAVAEEETF